MSDMLVKLYQLPDFREKIRRLEEEGIIIRQALAPEKYLVTGWIKDNFSPAWASEGEVAFSNQPVSCFIATRDKELLGFACYESTCKGFFGPTGVIEDWQGRGIGTALLLSSLNAMKEMGYAYAIIGGAGPVEYYEKACGAIIIPDSTPGIYRDLLL